MSVVSRRRRFRAGWWDGVQPGPGSERANSDVLYLKDMHPTALKCIAARSDEIACVCVSPLQGLNPGSPPPSDLVLLDAKVRKTAEKGNAYRQWLHTLQQVCQKNDVPLLFDEVYTGFRMAPGGAQEYYGADSASSLNLNFTWSRSFRDGVVPTQAWTPTSSSTARRLGGGWRTVWSAGRRG